MTNSASINCRGRLLSLEHPLVMGIINLTSDSFYALSRAGNVAECVRTAEKMISEGADILDLGAMSSRPGSAVSSPASEKDFLLPAIDAILKEFPDVILSVDTLHSDVAEGAMDHGAHIINDISGGVFDPAILSVAARHRAPYIMMHMKGLPETMQNNPQYEDVVMSVLNFFTRQYDVARSQGIMDVILDPGFGFGKTTEHNYDLLRRLEVFQILDCPVLAGLSRKSMIWKVLETTPEEALNGTTALHMAALLKGANILRVHDVREAKEVVKLFLQLQK
jgi:dihydropteroate synthase